jgi:DNA-binding beta-propeller fold protein YncE
MQVTITKVNASRVTLRPNKRFGRDRRSEGAAFTRLPPGIFSVAVAACVLAACSGGVTSYQSPGFSDLARSGVAPALLSRLHVALGPANIKPQRIRYRGLRDVYVSDIGNDDVVLLKDKTYTYLSALTDGIYGPDGAFIDKKGNFYVANFENVNITQYAPHATKPTFTYNAGMTDPVDVTVDGHGNVYEADYLGGFVAEYAQKTNTQLYQCSPGEAEGVAVDQSGDVFVDFGSSIVEYIGGLSGCTATPLGITLESAGGMAIDRHDDLLVCDQLGQAVDVIAPPYTSVTRVLQSGYAPFHVTINKDNNLAFVASVDEAAVYVVDYATGGTLATLEGKTYGLADPVAAVYGPNDAY